MLLSCNDTLDLDARWNPAGEPELTRVESEPVLYGTFHEEMLGGKVEIPEQ